MPDPQAFKTPEPVSMEVRSSRSKSTLDRPHNAVQLSSHSPKQQRRNGNDEVQRVRSDTSVNIPLPVNLPPPPPTTPRGAQTARARIESNVDLLPTMLPMQVSSPVNLPPPPPPIC
eukprot:TRINITY_DN1894_c0_g1_i2.p1 TRINITY_DN1894_c0_g1~~TRINITY_DN1894_c0_g1_i2.p1  ORF type:complete len:116 (+),score=21.41 TRINITY_DN1894_c0_g1_i2:505-852(+)